MSSLYELTNEMLELQEMLEQAEDLDAFEVVIDTTEAVKAEFDAKMENYAKLVKSIEASQKAREEECKRLKARCDADKKKVAKLKAAMMGAMNTLGITESGGDILSVKIAGNGGPAPIVVMADPKDLPDEYRKVTYDANNEAIRKALEAGEDIDFACFADRGVSLRIR